MLKTLTAAAFALSLALPAFADGPLESQMTAWLVGYDDAGEETLTQVEDVAPGALVEYRHRQCWPRRWKQRWSHWIPARGQSLLGQAR
ncbi:MAG: hypothetical protein AAFO57_12065 [Pseudomonadota bacterium]